MILSAVEVDEILRVRSSILEAAICLQTSFCREV